MFYGNTPQDIRQFYYQTWEKYLNKQPLSSLEQQILSVILEHPEYHSILNQKEPSEQNYHPELGMTNPFLHMGLHLAIRDQCRLNRPVGIQALYQTLCQQQQDPLEAEHQMMTLLAECLWESQRNQAAPDEQDYLQKLLGLLKK